MTETITLMMKHGFDRNIHEDLKALFGSAFHNEPSLHQSDPLDRK